MKRHERISVVICTKNRSKDLSECLGSIASINGNPDELIIVDNNSTDETPQVVNLFKKSVSFPVRYIVEKKTGYSTIYNRGLSQSKYRWIMFIDDDCIASKKWLSSFRTVVNTSHNPAVIIGKSDTLYSSNLFSLATMFNIWYWKQHAIQGSRILDFEVLDNKNIVYNKTFLQKNGIRFSNNRNRGCEDCDVGMQIQKAGGYALYERRALVLHKDPTTLGVYLKKTYNSAIAGISYRNAWNNYRRLNGIGKRKITASKALPLFAKKYHLSILQTSALALLLYLTYTYIKILIALNKHAI
jgi:glycosyltransferase involved in cell wall biosynthesis